VLLLLKEFQQQMQQFSVAETKIVSLVFQHIILKHGSEEGVFPKDLKQSLPANESSLLETILHKFEDLKILRKRSWQGKVWYELSHELFFKTLYEWNETYKTHQNQKRLLLKGIFLPVLAGTLLFVGYDGWINATFYHLRLSPQISISDTIEVYQGQTNTFDLFKQQQYRYETHYSRKNIEVDKLFQDENVEKFINQTLIEKLPLIKRLQAYWKNGNIDQVLHLATIAINDYDRKLSYQIIDNLADFRSVKSLQKFGELLPQTSFHLKIKIISSLGYSQPPFEITSLLLPFLTDENPVIRLNTLKALGHLGSREAVKPLIELLKGPEEAIHDTVIEALGEIGSNKAIQPLIELFKKADSDIQARILKTLK
jgi:hypothetical protein